MPKLRAKICGLKTPEAIKVAEDNGAEFLGFIFQEKSPRYIKPQEAGKVAAKASAKKVAVVVDASDELLDEIIKYLKPDYIQLHGNETIARAKEIKQKYKLPLIYAVMPGNPAPEVKDLFEYLLFDGSEGGKGTAFDWKNFTSPSGQWFLSGGLNIDNIAEAVRTTGATMVDISSGVESSPGVKDPEKIKAFLKAVNELKK